MNRTGLKLKDSEANMAALKILKKHFPNESLASLKDKIQNGDCIYLTGKEKYVIDGKKMIAALIHDFDQVNIKTELYEVYTHDGQQKRIPMAREVFFNMLHRYQVISQQVDEDIDNETDE